MQVRVEDGRINVFFDFYSEPADRSRKDRLRDLHLFRYNRSTSTWSTKYDPVILLQLVDTFGKNNIKTDEQTNKLFQKVFKAEEKRLEKRAQFRELKQTGAVDLEGYRFDAEPFGAHQARALTCLKHTNVAALFFDCGLGKTYTTLMWLRYLMDHYYPELKALIVAPLNTLYSAWACDVESFCPEMDYLIFNQSVKEAREGLAGPPKNLYLLNYAKMRILRKELTQMGFDAMVVDESKKIANARTKTTKAAWAIGDRVKHRAILSGLPAPNSKLEYWSQIRFLSKRAFGLSFLDFRRRFFIESGFGGFTWNLNPEVEEKFEDTLKDYAFRARAEDYIDLPPTTEQRIKVLLPKSVQSIYEEYFKYSCAEIEVIQHDLEKGNYETYSETWISKMILDKLLKCREICSGFLMKRDKIWDEDKDKITTEETIRDIHDEKVKALGGLLEEIGPRPVIVWIQFQYEVELLKRKFPNALIVNSTVTQNQREEAIKTFKETPEDQECLLIAHPRSLGHGLTFTNCCYNVWYSLDWSLDAFHQANKRVHRIGQNKTVHYYYLEAAGVGCEPLIDAVIYERLQGKFSTQLQLLNRLLELKHDSAA